MISAHDSLTSLKQWFMNMIHCESKGEVMNKSDLIEALGKDAELPIRKAEKVVKMVFNSMAAAFFTALALGFFAAWALSGRRN
ncbi:unnamed protein product [marine sediment metagenome]|uniref:Uncharacterized protein n=1 Tax=marine sediment metagenome TaxID=412755 RepID=X1CGA5_9ZZZZ